MVVDVAVERHLGGEAGPAVGQDAAEGLVPAMGDDVALQPGHGAGGLAGHFAALPLTHKLLLVLLRVHVLDAQVLQQVRGVHHSTARLPLAHHVPLLGRRSCFGVRGRAGGGRWDGFGGEGGWGGEVGTRSTPVDAAAAVVVTVVAAAVLVVAVDAAAAAAALKRRGKLL